MIRGELMQVESDARTLRTELLTPRDVVSIGGRRAMFLYRRRSAAIVRFDGQAETRVVPLAKLHKMAHS